MIAMNQCTLHTASLVFLFYQCVLCTNTLKNTFIFSVLLLMFTYKVSLSLFKSALQLKCIINNDMERVHT